VRKRELDVGSAIGEVDVELGDTLAPALRVLDGGRADDLDGAGSGAVTASHVLVHGVDGASEADVTVLTVHVGSTAARVVLHPDAIVLDVSRVLLHDLLESNEKRERVRGSERGREEEWISKCFALKEVSAR